jgi:hypothetical protein
MDKMRTLQTRFRLLLSFLIVLSFGLCLTAGAVSPVLLKEDFETVVDGLPSGWTLAAPGPMGLSTEYVFSGATSFYMEDLSNQSAVTIRSFHIPVEAGQEYMASIWAMVIKGNAFLYMEFWSSPDEPRIHFVTDRIEASKEWQQLVTKEVAPENAVSMTITLSLIRNNVGKTYYDNLEVVKVEE